jgi:phage shock protein A
MGSFLVVLGVVLVVLIAANTRAAKRWWEALSAQIGRSGRAALKADPMAVYQNKIDQALDNMNKVRSGLEASAGEVRSTQRRLAELQAEKSRLENRIRAVLANGDPNNSAAGYATQLARVEENLEPAEGSYNSAKNRYETFANKAKAYQDEIDDARREAKHLGYRLQQSQREREMAQFSSSLMDGMSLGSLAEARQAVESQIDENQGAVDANSSLNSAHFAEQSDLELERKAKADEILARYRPVAQ